MKDIFIKSIGSYLPKGRLSNQDIMDKFKSDNNDTFNEKDMDFALYNLQRKFEFLGIETRSFCNNDQDHAINMAVMACKEALIKSDMIIDDIECIICSGICNPFREPSFSIILANQLGLYQGNFFDINDTCNGFLKSIDLATLHINTGKHNTVMVVTCETPYEYGSGAGYNYKVNTIEDIDNVLSSYYVGSGAAAMIISSNGNGKKIKSYVEKRSSSNWDLAFFTSPGVKLPPTRTERKNTIIWSNPRIVSSLILNEFPVFIKETVNSWNMQMDDFDLFFLHQLGNNVTFAILNQINVPYNKAPVNTFNEFGNMATANIPINLCKAEEKGLIKVGDNILLIGSACGLTYSLMHLEW